MPSYIRYDQDISAGAKVLYSEIYTTVQAGYSFHLNNYQLAEMYSVTTKTIKNWLSVLESTGYIQRVYYYSEYGDIDHREIKLGGNNAEA
jgi:DeoR/GlpR family transcriptional regulator of sugar metabolism